MRKIMALLVGAAALNSACAAPMAVHGRPYGAVSARAPLTEVIGRWDNVMMLPPGSHVVVLLMDGTRAEGDIAAASATALKVTVAAGDVELPVDRVARVDRINDSTRLQRAVSGAVHGLGAVGLLGLLSGQLPPPRVFAGAGIAGADMGIHANREPGAETVYVAFRLRR